MTKTSRFPDGRRPVGAIGTCIVAAMLAGCAGSGQATAAGPSATPAVTPPPSLGPAAVTIQATDGGDSDSPPMLMPASISIKSGAVLELDDTGSTEHNLTIDASGHVPTSTASRSDKVVIAVDLVDTVAQAPINLPPGTYTFYCSIDFGNGAGHTSLKGTGMVGTLTVTP